MQPTPAAPYDEHYYANCCGAPYVRYGAIWEHHQRIAEQIATVIAPRTAFDAGCAKGFIVETLRKRGIEAWGVDISSYAIGEVAPEIRPYCRVASVTEPLDRSYDLILCQEVLEHISLEDSRAAIKNFCEHTTDIVFSSSPLDLTEPTHINVHEPEFWALEFAAHGFFPDHDTDLSCITPWAIRFRKLGEPIPRIVESSERRLWQLKKEVMAKESFICYLQQAHGQKDQRLAEQEKRLAQQESQLTEQRTRLAEHETQLAEQETQLAEQGEQLAELGTRLVDQEKRLAQQETQLAEQGTQLTEQGEQLTEREKRLALQEKRLAERKQRIRQLRENVLELQRSFANRAWQLVLKLLKVR